MSIIEIILLAVALAMDAFAVSICKGLAMRKADVKACAVVGLWFGGFQALMPFIGFLLGTSFTSYIEGFDHWIAFALLALIGGNMIKESLGKDEESSDASLGFKVMLVMAIATSIDALAVGIAFAALKMILTEALAAAIIIGVVTFVISSFGVRLGNIFGSRFKSKAEFAGGVVLIAIGLKILLEHTGILSEIGIM